MKTFFSIAILTGLIALSACTRESTLPGKLTVRWELPPQIVTTDVNREAPTIDPQLDQQLRTIGSYQLTKKLFIRMVSRLTLMLLNSLVQYPKKTANRQYQYSSVC